MATPARPGLTVRTSTNGPGQIDMIDNTRTQAEIDDSASNTAGSDIDEIAAALEKNPLTHTVSRLNRQSLRHELAKRKYNKYSEARYAADERPNVHQRTSSGGINRTDTAATTTTSGSLSRTNTTGTAAQEQASRIRRGGRRVKGLLRRRKRRHGPEGDVEVDVLIENQRGAYFFGRPMFSSQSLLNFDPPAWLNGQGRPSGVNITNAQVPDPSWEWSWSSWYVDMSQDVDEQGWQYSFMFQNRFPWHGTHPWFHSYVRRRRWVRKRVRKHRPGFDGRTRDVRSAKEAHKLNSDYFTIHPANRRDADTLSNAYSATLRSGSVDMLRKHHEEEEELASDDVDTIGALLKRLRIAEVDRDKIKHVLRFMDEGGQDTFYLAEEIPYIMSLLVFEYSKRRLLSAMVAKMDRADAASDKEKKDQSDADADTAKQKTDSWHKAIDAADKQIQQLEYWSDIRDAVNKAESQGATSEASGWHQGWAGLDSSGPGAGSINETSPVNTQTVAKAEAEAGRGPKQRDKGKQRQG